MMSFVGSGPSNNELSGKSIDKMNPSSREDFETFEELLKAKITQYEVRVSDSTVEPRLIEIIG